MDVDQLAQQAALKLPVGPQPAEGNVALPVLSHCFFFWGGDRQVCQSHPGPLPVSKHSCSLVGLPQCPASPLPLPEAECPPQFATQSPAGHGPRPQAALRMAQGSCPLATSLQHSLAALRRRTMDLSPRHRVLQGGGGSITWAAKGAPSSPATPPVPSRAPD